MGLLKMNKQRAALRSTLRLLVMIREMLKSEGAEDTSLFVAVRNHANLCGLALPNKDRLTEDEVEKIRLSVTAPPKPPTPGSTPLPVKGQMVILTPDQLQCSPIVKPKS